MPRQLPVEAAAGVGGKGKAARRRAAQEQADLKTELAARRLSAVDAAFLYIERKEIPLHMALVTVFDGPIPFEEFVASIQAKMHLIPRYSQIVELTFTRAALTIWDSPPARTRTKYRPLGSSRPSKVNSWRPAANGPRASNATSCPRRLNTRASTGAGDGSVKTTVV